MANIIFIREYFYSILSHSDFIELFVFSVLKLKFQKEVLSYILQGSTLGDNSTFAIVSLVTFVILIKFKVSLKVAVLQDLFVDLISSLKDIC